SVHRGARAQVDALVQQFGPHLPGCLVTEPFAVEHRDDVVALSGRQTVRRCGLGYFPWCFRQLGAVSVVGRAVDSRQATGGLDPDQGLELCAIILAGLGYEFSESALSDTISKSACAFPNTSMAASVCCNFLDIRVLARSSRAFSLRNCSSSACSGVFFFAVVLAAEEVFSSPVWRCLRHSWTLES